MCVLCRVRHRRPRRRRHQPGSRALPTCRSPPNSPPPEGGPGVYDIHSPRVPSAAEATDLLRKGLEAIPAERLRINPDCGLKAHGWPEVRTSLQNLVTAARTIRDGPPATTA
ncbi:hypothetical protein [Actinomadura sp. DC4]|uniref:hypothetical protein n=1 Tax=Actinomadura sp. DC4 TaxID=3055069 RepID=UPI0025B2454F|nr:hypothetical protein [Actinomadura sp. DC4]MDN3357341.1 hypothetical protein [Actinomadura sp. DC4]